MIQAVVTLLYAILFPIWALRRWPGWTGVAIGGAGAVVIAVPAFLVLAYVKKLALTLFGDASAGDPGRFVDSTPTAILIVLVISPIVATALHLYRTRNA
mgnify:CR=1 FL=1